MVKNSVDQGLGIVVNCFCLWIQVNQLAGGDCTICCDGVLDKHEYGTTKLTSRTVSHGNDVIGFYC